MITKVMPGGGASPPTCESVMGAGDENRTRTISLGMSAADGPGQPSRRSACTLVAPSMTVNPRTRPTHRARDGHGGPFAPKPSRLRFGEMRSGR
jgi:hypothetical protein